MAVKTFVVHYLRHGVTLCQQPGLPNTWPEDHRWVTSPDDQRVTCPTCKTILATRLKAHKERTP
jgi:hypothetical protein